MNEVENGIRDLLTALDLSKDRITDLEAENAKLREALEYYGDRQHPYCWDNPNFGDTARAALADNKASQEQDK